MKSGPGTGETTSIASGLDAGETVITEGGDRLRDGARRSTLPGRARPLAQRQAPAARRRRLGGGEAAATERRAAVCERGHAPMSPSRPFIVRPVATSLLDGGDPARRPRGVPLPVALGAAGGRLPDHPGPDLLSRRAARR